MPPFKRPRRLELEFQRELDRLLRAWIRIPKNAKLDEFVTSLFKAAGNDVMRECERIATKMVTAVAIGNATSWRAAAAKATQGKRIHNLLVQEMTGPVGITLRNMVSANARLIRTLPADLAQDISGQIATRQMRGERAETIAKDLGSRLPEIAKSRIALLARTQVASTATAISRARAQHLSLPVYQWDTSEDSRVRMSHRKMDKVLVFWNDPPSPEALIGVRSTLGSYHAGQCPNCRCDANVIVTLDQVTWPAKVYRNGAITRMSRAAFAKISGI